MDEVLVEVMRQLRVGGNEEDSSDYEFSKFWVLTI